MSKIIEDNEQLIKLIAQDKNVDASLLKYSNKPVYQQDNIQFERDCLFTMQLFANNLNKYITNELVVSVDGKFVHAIAVKKEELPSSELSSYVDFFNSEFPSYAEASTDLYLYLKFQAIKSLLFTQNENMQISTNYEPMSIYLGESLIVLSPIMVATSSVVTPNRNVFSCNLEQSKTEVVYDQKPNQSF